MKPLHLLMSHTALFAVALGLGWLLRGHPPPPAAGGPLHAPVRPATQTAPTAALIVVSDDGRATLHVDQQPLDWVIEQIEQQSARRIARGSVPSAPVPAAAAATGDECSLTPELPRGTEPVRVLQAIESGSEADRFDGLQQARAEGIVVAPALLRTLFETDASERVRLAAFESWLESLGDRPELLRPALEAALGQGGTVLPAEARRRLDELRQMEQVDPADRQRGASP